MLVWLASYPRSGNTFARLLLKSTMDLETRTIVGARSDFRFEEKADVLRLLGASSLPTAGQELIDEAHRSDDLYTIKTHDGPLTDDKAIYLVRDGRSSVISYFHYLNQVESAPSRLEDIIGGDVYPGGWSDHFAAWSPQDRSNTLLVRYEDLVEDTDTQIKAMAEFLDRDVVGAFTLSFDDLKAKFPQFFRAGGNDANIRELEASGCEPLFWEHHRPLMERLGYGTGPSSIALGGGRGQVDVGDNVEGLETMAEENEGGRGYGKTKAAVTFDNDGLTTVHDSSFLNYPPFQYAYAVGSEIETSMGADLHIEWRTWIAIWAARQALLCEGDFVECGVYTGVFSGAICAYLGFEQYTDRTFWLLDTFDGLPEEQLMDGERALDLQNYNHEYRRPELVDRIRTKFSRWPNIEVVQGPVPDTLSAITTEKIAYLSLDMNMAFPEIAAAEALWPRLSPGGIMLLDDYNQVLHMHQKGLFDQFAAERGVPIMALPTGQGLIIKPAG
ncbi:TylF/MycF/NovP-related O-methyltransferase [Brevundimonas sp.]|uniref:TylF/MycF/NovP-related O-methyltransferase n=1 Tax=Brevundimonas sp. TaxID=1871086 RepID=UPI0025BF0FD6|nr:TylF/MycF/NovP-related O-methyltransferase [Brevundimonas sp.]